MKLKASMAATCGLVIASAAILACGPFLAAQQRSRHHITEARPFTSIDDVLNREATASNAAGLQQFSEDLLDVIVPDKAGDGYIESLASRLARAEQMSREGKRKLIPETDIVQVYNDTMRKTGAPFKTDEATIRKFREHSIAVPSLPALLTANRNGTYCTPAEAVYLLYLLFWANGDLPLSVLDNEAQLKQLEAQGKTPMRGPMIVGHVHREDNSGDYLTSYSLRHNRHATTAIFDHIARVFGL
jgi:hypothetical protein